MKNKVLLDTNILIYLQEGLDAKKHKLSQKLFEKLANENVIVLSTQVLQEFFVAMTRKLNHDPITVKQILLLFEKFEIVTIQFQMVMQAIDISVLNKLSFWDSLIITAAEVSNCKVIYSEDLNPGQKIKGITIVNPFLEKE